MTFTVTYRSADGALHTEVMEASGRTECLAQMRARGVTPTDVKEGAGNLARRNAAPNPSGCKGEARAISANGGAKRMADGGPGAKSPSIAVRRLLAAACAALLAAGGVWWWLGNDEVRPSQVETSNKSKAEKTTTHDWRANRTLAPINGVAAHPVTSAESAKSDPPKRETWLGREIVSKKVVTNGTDLIITRVDVDGKIHKEYTTIHRRLFTNPVDIALSILLTTPEGALTPPLPPLGPRAGDAFIEALKKPIEIPEDASPEERRIRELVIAAREEMLEELGNGRSVNDVIEDHCTFVDANNKLRAEAMVQYKKLLAEGDEEMAEDFRAKANEMFAQKGIKQLKSLNDIRQERVSRREEKK